MCRLSMNCFETDHCSWQSVFSKTIYRHNIHLYFSQGLCDINWSLVIFNSTRWRRMLREVWFSEIPLGRNYFLSNRKVNNGGNWFYKYISENCQKLVVGSPSVRPIAMLIFTLPIVCKKRLKQRQNNYQSRLQMFSMKRRNITVENWNVWRDGGEIIV